MPALKPTNIAPGLTRLAVAIETLSADPANVRKHDARSIDSVAESLRRFGQQKPIVIDKSGVIIAGHAMLEAARRLGWTHIAAARSSLQGHARAAYAIADNRTAELSAWDSEALTAQLASMPAALQGACGFTPEEVMRLRDENEAPEVPAPAPLPTSATKPGDMWRLGEHRILCGDSTKTDDVGRLMGGAGRAALVSTDPPYLVNYTGVRTNGRGKDWSGQYREIEIKDAASFYTAVFAAAVSIAAPGAAFYCWHAHKRFADLVRAWHECGLLDHQQIVWVKPVPVFGSSMWHFRHEPCLVGWVKKSKPRHDGRHDHNSAWEVGASAIEAMSRDQLLAMVRAASDVWFTGWTPDAGDGAEKARPVGNEHPTQKPVEIFARPMRKHTRPGDIVYEPFSGSGSQLIAAEQLARRCRAMELEPVFVDVAVRRWQRLTGKPAMLDGTKHTWAAIAKQRGVRVPADD